MTPAEFFASLYGQFDEGYLTVFSIDAAKQRYVDWFPVADTEGAARRAEVMRDRDVWFGVATRIEPIGAGKRGGDVDCLSVPAMWLDIDIAGPNHKDPFKLPTDADQARKIIDGFDLAPTLVVDSGGGLHCYWQLDEPLHADDARSLLARWAATWAKIADELDMRVDNVFDLARVLRVPGTINHKPECGAVVRVTTATDVRYSYSDIIDATIEPPQAVRRERTGVPLTGNDAPGVDFNARHNGGYVLGMAGWSHDDTERSGNEKWLHPWSPSSDCSATVYADDGHTTIWSDTACARVPALEVKRPYDPFGLYTMMMHDGDFREAAKTLAAQGYGGKAVSVPDFVPPAPRDDADADHPTHEPSSGKPYIITGGRHLDDLTNDVVAALIRMNTPETMFRHGDSVSAFHRGSLEPIDRVRLMNAVETNMRPVTYKKDAYVPSRIDPTALDLSLLRLLDELPPVEGVLHAPFLRPDGSVCTDVGYDHLSRCYLTSTMPIDIADVPTPEQITRAIAVVDEMLCDFPIATPADRAHVFGLLLTLLTRHLVPLAPMFVIDGNGPGVGKNLLSECCVYIATGEWVQTDPLPLDNEEQRKQITALLSEGRSIALFDEAHTIGGTSLARLITSTSWGDRLLGYSRQVNYPNKMTVIGLGNNVEIQGDMPRRCIVIRMASDTARPELRGGFRHDDLRGWVTTNRASMLEALLTILRGWTAAGRPPSSARLGSFDAWAALIGGALSHAGVPGFLDNAEEMRTRSATDDSDMEAHLEELYDVVGDTPFAVRRVVELIDGSLLEVIPPKVSPGGQRVSQQVGHIYRRYSDRWVGDYKITQGGLTGKARRWAILRRDADSPRIVLDSPHGVAEVGGLGGLGGLSMPTHKKKVSVRDEGGENAQEVESSPPSPPSPPDTPITRSGSSGRPVYQFDDPTAPDYHDPDAF